MLKNILSSGFDFSENEYELKTKYILLNSMLIIVSISLAVVGSFRFLTSYVDQGMIDYLGTILSILMMIVLRWFQKGEYRFAAYIIALMSASLIVVSYYASNGLININTWFIALIIPIFFILGYRTTMLMAVFFMILIVMLDMNYVRTDTLNKIYGYVPLFLSVIFLHIYEYRFYQFTKILTDTNNNLEQKVKEKTLERTQVLEEQKNKLDHQAHHDYLTALPNRVKFQKEIQNMIDNRKDSNNNLAIFFIDLDHFKNINDSFGHDIGDQVIKITAKRIRKCIRKDDCLARFGGDEFVVLIDNYEDKNDLEAIAENIISCISKPVLIDNMTMFVSCSIGISLHREEIDSYHDFIKYADTAMYKAKEKGRNNYQFYTSEMTEVAFDRVLMETSMRFALEKEEFIVHYQPQVDGRLNKIIGMEALVRWNHEKMGLISPATFIPLAEETGLIIALDQWVMKTGMVQMREWYEAGLNPGRLSLNLSMKQLQQEDFIEIVKNILNETGCKAEWIEFEITESHIMHNVMEAIETLNNIKALGISIAIDDFGTGYSSLSYLKKLPVDKLKIDRSFIMDIPDNREDAAITNAIIAIAESLNLRVIAEGVETRKQKEYLLECGCHFIQGYLYYRPMPAEKMAKVLQQR
jgi:diguanylate cyclase (GGDEF)-like protein